MIGNNDKECRRLDRRGVGIVVWSWGLFIACSSSPPAAKEPDQGRGALLDSPGHEAATASHPALQSNQDDKEPERAAQAQTWTLQVEGHSPTLVYTPPGSQALPLWFVAHGAGGSAEEQLNYWSRLLRDEYVIVSLAGVPLYNKYPERGHYYKDHIALGRELEAVINKLGEGAQALPYAHRLGAPPFMFGAFSQGATMGAIVLLEHPELFQRLLLIEGGYEGWTSTRAQRYQAGGGQKVMWVCGTASCLRHAREAARVAEQAGLDTHAEWVEGGGHAYWGLVETRVTQRLPWLL